MPLSNKAFRSGSHPNFGPGDYSVWKVGSGKVYIEWLVYPQQNGEHYGICHPLDQPTVSKFTDTELIDMYTWTAAHVYYVGNRTYPGTKHSLQIPAHVCLEDVLAALASSYTALATELDDRSSRLRFKRSWIDYTLTHHSQYNDAWWEIIRAPRRSRRRDGPSTEDLLPKLPLHFAEGDLHVRLLETMQEWVDEYGVSPSGFCCVDASELEKLGYHLVGFGMGSDDGLDSESDGESVVPESVRTTPIRRMSDGSRLEEMEDELKGLKSDIADLVRLTKGLARKRGKQS